VKKPRLHRDEAVLTLQALHTVPTHLGEGAVPLAPIVSPRSAGDVSVLCSALTLETAVAPLGCFRGERVPRSAGHG